MSATDDIFAQFKTAWDLRSPAFNGGSSILVQWPNVDWGSPPDPRKPWVRVMVRETDSFQATLGPTGSRKFTRAGVFSAQVFYPKNINGGATPAHSLGRIIRDAFEGKRTASGIWFRNALVQDVGTDETWYQVNTTVQFTYDEIK